MSEIISAPPGNVTIHAPVLPIDRVLVAVIAAASDPAVDVSKMRELLGLQKELMALQADQQFDAAFHRLQAEMPRIKRSGAVEYKGKIAFHFATWEAIDSVIRPLLQREGFSLSFDTVPRQGDGGGVIVTGTLSHVGGAKRTASIPVALDSSGGKNNIQGMGSSFSYGKRYTTTALLNIVTEGEDDDGARGGARFISEAQADELRELCRMAGRQEGAFIAGVFEGSNIRSFDEIEEGVGHIVAKNMLDAIIKRAGKNG
jgi:hypothetical protein